MFFILGIVYYFGLHNIKIRAKDLVIDSIHVSIARLPQGKEFYEAVKHHSILTHFNPDSIQ